MFTGKCELGQGILTALAQIAAEELDVAYERVEMVSADTARTPNEGQTAGSLSVENSGTALRFACAEARQILLELAAAKLGVADRQAVRVGRNGDRRRARSPTGSSRAKRTWSARPRPRRSRNRPRSTRSSAAASRAATSRPR